MQLYCITTQEDEQRAQLLKEACSKKEAGFVHITAEDADFTNMPTLVEGDMLYRASAGEPLSVVRTIEQMLIQDNVVTLHRSRERAYADYPSSYIIHAKHGIPVPRTVSYITPDREALRKQVEFVGGFPVILKAVGHSKGVGVIKVDSLASLFSIVDYLCAQQSYIIMREFIPLQSPVHSCRAVVIGNKVEIAYRNESTEHDEFRSNVNQNSRRRESIALQPQQAELLVKSVQVLGLDVGAVDFVVTEENGQERIVLFEVNFPFNFVPVATDMKHPIHEKLVEFLLEKQRKLRDNAQ